MQTPLSLRTKTLLSSPCLYIDYHHHNVTSMEVYCVVEKCMQVRTVVVLIYYSYSHKYMYSCIPVLMHCLHGNKVNRSAYPDGISLQLDQIVAQALAGSQ